MTFIKGVHCKDIEEGWFVADWCAHFRLDDGTWDFFIDPSQAVSFAHGFFSRGLKLYGKNIIQQNTKDLAMNSLPKITTFDSKTDTNKLRKACQNFHVKKMQIFIHQNLQST